MHIHFSFVFKLMFYVNYIHPEIIAARSELRKVLFLAQSVCGFLFVYEIPREPLNGFAPN